MERVHALHAVEKLLAASLLFVALAMATKSAGIIFACGFALVLYVADLRQKKASRPVERRVKQLLHPHEISAQWSKRIWQEFILIVLIAACAGFGGFVLGRWTAPVHVMPSPYYFPEG